MLQLMSCLGLHLEEWIITSQFTTPPRPVISLISAKRGCGSWEGHSKDKVTSL